MKKIGIAGSGNMGRTIGLNLASRGHHVYFGSRRKEVLDEIQELAGSMKIDVGTNEQAILASDIILYCLRDVGPSSLVDNNRWDGKIVIDLNNWPNPTVPLNFDAIPISIAEKHQQDVPNAHFVKAFNTLPQEIFNMAPEEVRRYNPAVFYCGDNDTAMATVASLIVEMGLTPVHSGGLNQARILESMGNLIRVLISKQGLGIAFSTTQVPLPAILQYGARKKSSLK